MLDSRSGKQIKDDPFFVLVDHITDRTNSFVPTYPETEAVLVPSTVSVISASGSYGDDWPYVNCDVNSTVRGTEKWYTVSSIVNSGVVAPNHCTNRRSAASPGEFVFFVRKLTGDEKRASSPHKALSAGPSPPPRPKMLSPKPAFSSMRSRQQNSLVINSTIAFLVGDI